MHVPNKVINFSILKCFPSSERKYILAMFWCTMQEDKNICTYHLTYLGMLTALHTDCTHGDSDTLMVQCGSNIMFLLQTWIISVLQNVGQRVAEVLRKLFLMEKYFKDNTLFFVGHK